jgi:hypothetical protein
MDYCKDCKVGFLTCSEVFRDPEVGKNVILEWCSNALCDYNIRKYK